MRDPFGTCEYSEDQRHYFDPERWTRDDLFFYLKCEECGEICNFEVDTEEELYEYFGLEDDE